MKLTNNIEKTIRKKLNFTASAKMRERILTDVIKAQEDSRKTKPALAGPNRWSIIMKSPITKFTATALIVIAAVLLITILDKSTTPAYAIEQTIDALKNVRFVHLLERNQSGEIADERWIELDSDGRQIRYRQDTPPDFLDIEDGETVAMYRKDRNAVVLYDPKEKGFTIGPIGKILSSLAEQKLIIDENVEYRGRPAHRVRSLMANQDVFVDPETFLPIVWAGLEISYENPPKGTFEIIIPDGYTMIDKRPGAELIVEPEWLKEYEAADVNFERGIQALQEGEFETAASFFKHVVNNQPQRNWAWYWLGRTHYELGEYDLAIYEFTKTLEIVGSFSYCHYSRALAYSQKGMDNAAKEDLDKALPWMILALRYPEATTMFELADRPFGGKPYQRVNEEAQARMINRLRLATGQNFGYNPDSSTEEKEKAIAAWENWLQQYIYFLDKNEIGTRERARDGVVHIEEGLVLDIPDVRPLCDEMDVVKRRVNVGNCQLYCEIEGDGTPLVLINGGPGGTHHGFHPSFSRAKGFAKVIYYDQRGCGLSDYEQGDGYSMEQAVEDLENLRKALGVEKWVVLGHSYGGVLAQTYCVTYPYSIAGLILLASSEAMPVKLKPTRQYLFITERELAKMRSVREEIRRQQRTGKTVGEEHVVFNNWLNGDWKRQNYYKPSTEEIARIARYGWKHDKAFRQALGSDSRGVDLKGAFQDCPIPTLLLEGKWDLTWDTDKAGILGQNHPNGQLLIFQESAHSPFADEPEAFFNTLKDFIINLPNVPSQKLEQWKSYLDKWREEKKDPLLAKEMSPEEAKAIEEFRRVKARILAGERYKDTSTPLHAVLTFLSAKHYNTENYLMKLDILRAPLPAAQPEKGTLWPVYMRYPKRRKLADTFILAYSKEKWLWLGNQGCAIDWRTSRPTFEEWLERSGKEEFQSKR